MAINPIGAGNQNDIPSVEIDHSGNISPKGPGEPGGNTVMHDLLKETVTTLPGGIWGNEQGNNGPGAGGGPGGCIQNIHYFGPDAGGQPGGGNNGPNGAGLY
jgi:hypothetical protein